MRFSTVGRYALRAMIDLACYEGQGPILRDDIARRQGISRHYLAQLFARLKRAGLVESVLGPGGGYLLAQRAEQISAGDVLRAVEEPLSPVSCVDGGSSRECQRAAECTAHLLWQRLEQAISGVLDAITLADLSDPTRALQETSSTPERVETSSPLT